MVLREYLASNLLLMIILVSCRGPEPYACVNFYSLAQLSELQNIDLSAYTALRSVQFTFIWSAPDSLEQTKAITVWLGILAIIKTLHKSTVLASLVVENPLPRNLLRVGWSQSETIEALRRPLYLVDKHMVGLVDRGGMENVIITPQQRNASWSLQAQPFLDSEEIRFRDLFRALSDYGMLAFSRTM